MLLLIDVGNTNIVFGVYKDNKQVGSFRLTSNVTRTSDELGLNACAYFQRFGLNPCQVQDVIICSVVPGIMHALTNAIIKYFGRVPLVVNEHVFPTLKYPEGVDPYALGADRSVAAWQPWKSTAHRSSSWTSAPPPPWTPSTQRAAIAAAASWPASRSL